MNRKVVLAVLKMENSSLRASILMDEQPNFIEAMREGIAKASVNKRAVEEITAVLNSMFEQISKESKGLLKLEIARMPFKDLDIPDTEKRLAYAAITAVLTKGVKSSRARTELARWSRHPHEGYPCELSISGWRQKRVIANRSELVLSLQSMLRDPSVASKLFSLLEIAKREGL